MTPHRYDNPANLLTNDDGIHAPGIEAMHRALEGLGEVKTVALLTVQSATGHGITFHEPLMTEVVVNEEGSVAVDGRPADCVKLALRSLCSATARGPVPTWW